MIDHTFKIRVVNVQKVVEVPRCGIKSLDNISLIIMVKRIHKKYTLNNIPAEVHTCILI